MHGRLKVKTSDEKAAEKRKEREEKAKLFQSLTQKTFEKRERRELDDESLLVSAQLLVINPDFYTLWNYRREIILSIKHKFVNQSFESEHNNQNNSQIINQTNDEIICDKSNENLDSFQKLCENELQLTVNCLKVNPKSYCVWHQRSWIIECMPFPNLQLEISLCNQFLELDERNFHCWDYRRFVSKLAKINVEEELNFTLEKIKQNFSNFSSWYYRSCLFTYAANKLNFDFSKQWKQEYELVENALFTDPSDQSAWFYHKWLVSTNYGHNMKHSIETNEENTVRINKIVYNSNDSFIIINLSRPIKYNPLVMVYINDNLLTELEWNSASNNLMNSIWYSNKLSFSDNKITKISFKPIPTFAINPECVEQIDITNDETEDKQIFIWERNSRDADQELGLEENYLESLRCLRQLEPHNKWVNLSLAWIDPKGTQMNDVFETLIKIDPLRFNYYNDLKSKMIVKNEIKSSQLSTCLLMKNLKITALYESNRLTHIQFLDLSHNLLIKLSKNFNDLVSLEVLIMDFNNIFTIDKEFKLNKLKTLSLNNNKIRKIECLANLQNCIELKKLLIRENPISTTVNNIPVSQLLLSNELQVISSNSNINISDNIIDSYSKSKINYKLF